MCKVFLSVKCHLLFFSLASFYFLLIRQVAVSWLSAAVTHALRKSGWGHLWAFRVEKIITFADSSHFANLYTITGCFSSCFFFFYNCNNISFSHQLKLTKELLPQMCLTTQVAFMTLSHVKLYVSALELLFRFWNIRYMIDVILSRMVARKCKMQGGLKVEKFPEYFNLLKQFNIPSQSIYGGGSIMLWGTFTQSKKINKKLEVPFRCWRWFVRFAEIHFQHIHVLEGPSKSPDIKIRFSLSIWNLFALFRISAAQYREAIYLWFSYWILPICYWLKLTRLFLFLLWYCKYWCFYIGCDSLFKICSYV